jgi:DNA-binding MarR family transcriptional regulator
MSLLRKEIRQERPFVSEREEAFLNLQRTAALHSQSLAALLKGYGVTPTQYNAMRILRGAHPAAISCKEVGERMVTPVPDVTRLVDRLEKRGFVERARGSEDRRVVEVSITEEGRAVLKALDQPIARWMDSELSSLSDEEIENLIGLLEKARQGT